MRYTKLVFLSMVMLVAPVAWGSSPDDVRLCADLKKTSPDQAIKHCANVIGARELPEAELALMHYARAGAWLAKDNYNRAIEDFNAAIQINPIDGRFYWDRGVAKRRKGDIAGADADQAMARRVFATK